VSANLDGKPVEVLQGAIRVPLPRTAREHRIVVSLGD
jgi:hypothetical protein